MKNRRMLIIIFIAVSGGFADRIGPREEESHILRSDRESVTLSCTYETTSRYIYLYWYRQNTQPQYILRKGARSYRGYEDIPDDHFQSKTSDTSTELIIKSVSLSDSALYYCALRDEAQ
ncbi:TCR-alpha V segment II-41 [Triplophysa rosa]|nr:TCR-alpha V segment II-41 [Triplophysa rosa]